jgi:DNA-3-methyladenine glycosylase
VAQKQRRAKDGAPLIRACTNPEKRGLPAAGLGENGSISLRTMAAEPSIPKSIRLPGKLLKRSFFEAPPEQVAPRLLGKLLVHRTRAGLLAGRIVEVEAYLGPHHDPPDLAAHSHRGPTPRNSVLFGPAGHAYVYFIYGRYYCMNITCEKKGHAGSLLLRALEPVMGGDRMALNRGLELGATARALACGPSRLCQAMALTRPAHNGLDMLSAASPLQVRDDGFRVAEALVTPRIGIRHAAERMLRYAVPDCRCVSGPKPGTQRFPASRAVVS